jgi:hypothetical protein
MKAAGLFKSKTAAIRHCLRTEQQNFKQNKSLKPGQPRYWWETLEERENTLKVCEKEIRLLKSRLTKEMNKKASRGKNAKKD